MDRHATVPGRAGQNHVSQSLSRGSSLSFSERIASRPVNGHVTARSGSFQMTPRSATGSQGAVTL